MHWDQSPVSTALHTRKYIRSVTCTITRHSRDFLIFPTSMNRNVRSFIGKTKELLDIRPRLGAEDRIRNLRDLSRIRNLKQLRRLFRRYILVSCERIPISKSISGELGKSSISEYVNKNNCCSKE